jgi:hypothetical protein
MHSKTGHKLCPKDDHSNTGQSGIRRGTVFEWLFAGDSCMCVYNPLSLLTSLQIFHHTWSPFHWSCCTIFSVSAMDPFKKLGLSANPKRNAILKIVIVILIGLISNGSRQCHNFWYKVNFYFIFLYCMHCKIILLQYQDKSLFIRVHFFTPKINESSQIVYTYFVNGTRC